MVHAPGVVRGVPDGCRRVSSSVFISVSVFAEKRVQEVHWHVVDWGVSWSRMGRLADADAEEAIEPIVSIVLVNTQENDENDRDQTPGGGRSE